MAAAERTTSKKLDRILGDIRRLRPMPAVAQRILHAIDDPNTTAQSLCDLIAIDQAITAQVLQMANSALLGYGPDCSSIPDAIMRIGFNRLRTLVIGVSTSGPLTQRLAGYQLDEGGLFKHSLAAAIASQRLARLLNYPDPEEAYVAGLLHDMGKLVLDQYMLLNYREITQVIEKRNMELVQIEMEVFGVDHAGVGGMMAERWNFPTHLQDAIQHHHAPSFARTRLELAAIVNIANAITPEDSLGLTGKAGRDLHPQSLEILRLDQTRVDKVRSDMQEALKMGPRH